MQVVITMLKITKLPYSLRYDYKKDVRAENINRIHFIANLFAISSLFFFIYYLINPQNPIIYKHTIFYLGLSLIISPAVSISLIILRDRDGDRLLNFIQKAFLIFSAVWFVGRGALNTIFDQKIATFPLGIIIMAVCYKGSPRFTGSLIVGTGIAFIGGTTVILKGFYPVMIVPIIIYSTISLFLYLHLENNRIKLFILTNETKERNKALEELSFRDHLSRLYNRRYIMEYLEKLKPQMEYKKRELGLLMLDIDHFKRINDTFGHPIGDSVLREFSSLLQESVRKSDLVGRYGGEEFIVVLPDTGYEEALTIAENILKRVREHHFMELSWNLTVSLGCGILKSDEPLTTLIERVDSRLYKAKREGRDQVR